jgi:glucose-6-phosphate isomerase
MYVQSIDGCLRANIGDSGLDEATLDAWISRARPGVDRIRQAHRDGSLPVLQLAERRDDIPMIEDRAAYHRERAETVVVLGTGGSSLGGQAFYALADAGFGPSGDSPRVVFMDNIDPHTFDHLFRSLDLRKTDFLLISKSGSTAETMAQALICMEELAEVEDEARIGEHFTVITEPKDSALSRLAQKWGMVQLPHDLGIGGRFSALSLVGMLPAAIAGLDPAAAREGAEPVIASLLTDYRSPAAIGAALQCGLAEASGIGASVLMPYCDRLGTFGFWYRQLWAESLGKQGEGTLPVRALGTVDQHSQLQLYLDGPRDKLFSIVQTRAAGTGRLVRTAIADGEAGLGYLDGRSMGDLLDAMQRATTETLIKNGCPTRVFTVDRVDEGAVGALMMHFMAETIIAADMLGVDPFNQPAVEQGKILARDYMAQIRPRG